MSAVQIMDFDPECLDDFEFDGLPEFAAERIKQQAEAGICFVAYDNGKVIAIGGIIDLWPGVGEIWSVISKDIIGKWVHWVAIHRHAKGMVRMWFDAGGHRLQASIIRANGYLLARAWLHRLGFGFEGTMAQYGFDRSNYERWAIVAQGG